MCCGVLRESVNLLHTRLSGESSAFHSLPPRIVKYSTGLSPHLKPPDPREVEWWSGGVVREWVIPAMVDLKMTSARVGRGCTR
ncbi:hypothetical protein E2C01_035405 [Portunus trituberculatus]|uniref:Uncharacterized protein n=1 Tax=Portunus trituberculatus TaxID=210409 RepID=A0A5B7F9N8_PORTR|nr:hypothetical protein [Portunus trituberculatus]